MKNGGGCAGKGKTAVRQARRKYGPYHFDSLSGFRSGIPNMQWQQGNLRDGRFADRGTFPLIGSRDAAIARAIEYATSDLQPDPKLAQPNMPEDDVFF
jgi:hypothetical protein